MSQTIAQEIAYENAGTTSPLQIPASTATITRSKYVSLIIILGLLTAMGPFSIDMYLPGFTDIARDLHTSVGKVSLSLSGYFIGISIGQLFYGPLLDRFGRKKPLYFGLSLYILATAACMTANNINVLIALRFIQAIGSCAAAVASMAMVRDLFSVKDSAKVFSLLLLVVGASPMIAPTAGGYMITAFGWRSVFIVLFILGALITLLTAIGLPESHKADASYSLQPKHILNNYLEVFKNRQFLTHALTGALAFAGAFAYVAGSPIVFMDVFHVTKQVYGLIFALLSLGFIVPTQFNARLLKKYSSKQILRVTLIGQLTVATLFLVGNLAGWYGLSHTIIFIFLFLSFTSFINPNAAAMSLAPFAKNAGSAAALMGAIQMGIGFLATSLMSIFGNNTSTPMVIVMFTASLIALITSFIGGRSSN